MKFLSEIKRCEYSYIHKQLLQQENDGAKEFSLIVISNYILKHVVRSEVWHVFQFPKIN